MSAEVTETRRTEVGFKPVPIPKDNAQEALPRVSTARVPLLNTVPPEMNYSKRTVTRASDDTKHIAVQKFAHGKILDIGSEIHRLTRQAAGREREEAVIEAENRVWDEAEKIRIRALEEITIKLNAQHDEIVKRITKDHDKALKGEALKVETALRQQSLDQVKKEREDGERRLKLAIRVVEEKCQREKEEAVAIARNEEKENAKNSLDELDKSWQSKHDSVIEELNEDKQKELDRLAEKHDWEKQRAVLQTRQMEREIAAQELRKNTETFETKINILDQNIEEKEKEVFDLCDNEGKLKSHLKEVGKELFVTRDTFRDYIHQVSQCESGQADYQMPGTKFNRIDYCD